MSVSTLYVVYRAARDFDLGGGFQHSGNYPMVFLHSGARDFDLGGGFQHSGNYPMVFLHSDRGVSWCTSGVGDVGFPILFGGGFLSDTCTYPDVF
jgi:predicted TIM-barrel fold metal-dependent hydrolase